MRILLVAVAMAVAGGAWVASSVARSVVVWDMFVDSTVHRARLSIFWLDALSPSEHGRST